MFVQTEICAHCANAHLYTAGTDDINRLPPFITDVTESSAVHKLSCNQTLSSVSQCDEKMACCEVDSPTKHMWSNLYSVAPSVPIFTTTGEFG